MEEPQPNSAFASGVDQGQLGAVDRPVGGQVPAVLVRIGVSEHDFLHVAAGGHHGAVERKIKHRLQNRRAVVQVVDGLEQRRNPDRTVGLVSRSVQQPDLFHQNGRLEHVRHRPAHRDDVVGNGCGTVSLDREGGGTDDVEFFARQFGQLRPRAHQRAAGAELSDQQLDAFVFGQRGVIGMHPRPCQQFGDHLLVHVGVLPKIQRGQMETKYVHAFSQQRQPVVGQHRAAVRAQ